jgi:RNA polymerase sigma-70 factor (ECF subfamily)
MSHDLETGGPQFERFRAYLHQLARLHLARRLQSKLDASDLVQRTLLEACRSQHPVTDRDDAEVAAWLRQILAHQWAHALRDYGRQKRDVGLERSLETALHQSSARLEAWLAAEQSTPSTQAQRGEQLVRVAASLETLPEAQRQAVVLHFWEGMTLAQVAEHMRRSPASVAGLLQRGLKQLRTQLAQPE